MANCWFYRTAVDILLILILLVTVPFLIGMILVYSLSEHSSESCQTLCASVSSYNYEPHDNYYKVTTPPKEDDYNFMLASTINTFGTTQDNTLPTQSGQPTFQNGTRGPVIVKGDTMPPNTRPSSQYPFYRF